MDGNRASSGQLIELLLICDHEQHEARLSAHLAAGGLNARINRIASLHELATALARTSWDLILSASRVVDFDAFYLLQELHRRSLDIPVIVLSEIAGEELAVAAMRAGAHDYILFDNLARLVPAIERELTEVAGHRERRLTEQALLRSEQRLRQITENIDEVFWLLDCASGAMVYVSPAFERIWERSPTPLFARAERLVEWTHPEEHEVVLAAFNDEVCGRLTAEYRILLPDGSERWISTRSFAVTDSSGRPTRMAGLSTDISDRKRLEQESTTLTRALEQSADLVIIANAEGTIEYVNGTFEQVSGFSKAEVIGREPNLLKSGFQDDAFYEGMWKTLRHGLPFTDIFINRRKNGDLYYEAKTITPIRDQNGVITHFVSTGKDITTRLKLQERIQHLLYYDAVTGLPSRALFQERLNQALQRAAQGGLQQGLLLVSPGLGTLTADLGDQRRVEQLRRQVAERLREALGSEGLLAFLGEDEFAVLAQGNLGEARLSQLGERLLRAFALPLDTVDYQLFLTPSVGISLYPTDADSAEVLLHHARVALSMGGRGGEEQRCRVYRSSSLPPARRLSS